MEKKGFTGKKRIIGAVMMVMVAALALSISISVYSAPGNRLSRQLDLGHRYLENGQYGEAVLAFESAISIDEKCMEAYAGGIEAYLMMEDGETLPVFYDRALSMAGNLEEELLEVNREFVEAIYLAADRVYRDDSETALSVLEEGWNVTGSTDIKEGLIKGYLAIAEEKMAEEAYEEGLEVLDKLLELAVDDERALKALGKYLDAYFHYLMEEREYDKIRMLAEKYGKLAVGIDFDGILREIEEKEAEEKRAAAQENVLTENSEQEKNERKKESQEPQEDQAEDEESRSGEREISQSEGWVDDLYQKIIAEDVDAVFAIMEQPDFIEKCEAFPHSEQGWSIDYSLLTSDGKIFWVLKSIEYGDMYVTCSPGVNASDREIGGAVKGSGEYTFEIVDGERQFTKGAWGVFHM